MTHFFLSIVNFSKMLEFFLVEEASEATVLASSHTAGLRETLLKNSTTLSREFKIAKYKAVLPRLSVSWILICNSCEFTRY